MASPYFIKKNSKAATSHTDAHEQRGEESKSFGVFLVFRAAAVARHALTRQNASEDPTVHYCHDRHGTRLPKRIPVCVVQLFAALIPCICSRKHLKKPITEPDCTRTKKQE